LTRASQIVACAKATPGIGDGLATAADSTDYSALLAKVEEMAIAAERHPGSIGMLALLL
jgi:hypothetical protein